MVESGYRLIGRMEPVVAELVEVEDTEDAHSGSHLRIAAVGAAGADIRQGTERVVEPAAAVVAGSDSVENNCHMAAPGASHRDMS